jgi:hypothetical protein
MADANQLRMADPNQLHIRSPRGAFQWQFIFLGSFQRNQKNNVSRPETETVRRYTAPRCQGEAEGWRSAVPA